MASKPRGRSVSVVSLDPGSTSGLVVITIDTSWVRGLGPATWEGLGAAIGTKVAYQIGREPKAFFNDGERATTLDSSRDLDEHLLPILAGQPLVTDNGGRKTARFYEIMGGQQVAGGPPLSHNDAGEIIQARQIAGLLANYPEAAFVIEDFTLRTQVRSREVTSPDRLRLTTTSDEVLHGEGRTPFIQQPSYAKTTATDDRLKRAGVYFPGMPHATDAARHALTFLRDARQKETVRAAAWPRHFSDDFDAPEDED